MDSTVATNSHDKVVVAFAQALGDIHRVARRLSAIKIDIEACQPQCGLKMVPLLDRKTIAGVRIEDTGYTRHDTHRTGVQLEFSQYKK
jgi:hypothetical protein